MVLPTNMFVTVTRFLKSELAYLQNYSAFITNSNKKFNNFQNFEGNLGSSVSWDLTPRFVTADSLIATFQPSAQRQETLTVDMAKNVSLDYSNQQWIFNLEPMDYMREFGKAAVQQLGTTIERDYAKKVALNCYRFYGDGVTPINSFNQLSTMLALFRNYGSPTNMDAEVYLSDMMIPNIVTTGLAQFTPSRNDKMVNSWMIGDYDRAKFYRSNLLHTHTAGSCGDEDLELTVVSTNDPTGANITQITVSGAPASDADAIKENDLAYIVDDPESYPIMRYLQFIGQGVSENSVQFRITADAPSNGGGQVTLNITPGLVSVANANQNIAHNIVAGMKIKVIRSHRRGVIVGGNAFFSAMPRLPDEDPYKTIIETDKVTGASMRCYYGSQFGQNQRGMVRDVIWGVKGVPEYNMAIAIPLS